MDWLISLGIRASSCLHLVPKDRISLTVLSESYSLVCICMAHTHTNNIFFIQFSADGHQLIYHELSCNIRGYIHNSHNLTNFPGVGWLCRMVGLFSELWGNSTLSSIKTGLVYIPRNNGFGYLYPYFLTSLYNFLMETSLWILFALPWLLVIHCN